MKKKGQMKLSFGMIFSIILIIFFLVFAFFAIQKFLDLQKQVTIKTFYENLENDLNLVWGSTKATKSVTYNLPSNVEEVCLSPEKEITLLGDYISGVTSGSGSRYRKYVDSKEMGKINLISGETCALPREGKITFTLTKDYAEPLVTVEI